MRRLSCTSILLAFVAGCASATPIPDADRASLSDELPGQARFLKVSLYEGPFWRDDSKVLLSDVPPGELALLTDTHGEIIRPGPPAGVVPVGRRARILKVEFPTALVVASRMVYTPRYNPWIYLQVEGEDPNRPAIVVLRSDIKGRDQFLAALDQLLAKEDPAPHLAAYADEVRKAIDAKQVLAGMDTQAVQMAWGYPERKHIDVKGGVRSELWSYADGKRTAKFSDGKLTKFEATP